MLVSRLHAQILIVSFVVIRGETHELISFKNKHPVFGGDIVGFD